MTKSHPYRTWRWRTVSLTSAGIVLGSTLLLAYSDWAKKDASEWTDSDVRAILTDSPWTKQAKLNFAGNMGGGSPGGTGRMGGGGGYGGGQPGGGMGGPVGGGGMGGAGGGGGGMGGGGGYGGRQGGMGGGQPGGGQPDRYVTLQWVSATPVRLALLKRQAAGQASAEGAHNFEKPMDQYVLAVSGFPTGGGGGGWNRQGGGQDGDVGTTGDRPSHDPAQMAERLKANSELNRKGHDPIHPDNVTWDESNGSRVMMLFFPKTDAITLADKDVEIQIAMGPMEIKKKFTLKDMVYQGKLEL